MLPASVMSPVLVSDMGVCTLSELRNSMSVVPDVAGANGVVGTVNDDVVYNAAPCTSRNDAMEAVTCTLLCAPIVKAEAPTDCKVPGVLSPVTDAELSRDPLIYILVVVVSHATAI
jgi:hypothetical protein